MTGEKIQGMAREDCRYYFVRVKQNTGELMLAELPDTVAGDFAAQTAHLETLAAASIPGGASFKSARKTVTAAGTAEALDEDVDCRDLIVVADPDNAGNIYLGDADVDNTKGKLPPGGIMPCGAANLSEVFIDADNSSEGVSYFYTI